MTRYFAQDTFRPTGARSKQVIARLEQSLVTVEDHEIKRIAGGACSAIQGWGPA